MIHFIVRTIVSAFALLLIAEIIPGIHVPTLSTAILAAVVLGILNALVRPILFILTLPVTLITLGLFTFVLNAFMFWLAAYILEGFSVDGFVPALIGSIIMSAVAALSHRIFS